MVRPILQIFHDCVSKTVLVKKDQLLLLVLYTEKLNLKVKPSYLVTETTTLNFLAKQNAYFLLILTL